MRRCFSLRCLSAAPVFAALAEVPCNSHAPSAPGAGSVDVPHVWGFYIGDRSGLGDLLVVCFWRELELGREAGQQFSGALARAVVFP